MNALYNHKLLSSAVNCFLHKHQNLWFSRLSYNHSHPVTLRAERHYGTHSLWLVLLIVSTGLNVSGQLYLHVSKERDHLQLLQEKTETDWIDSTGGALWDPQTQSQHDGEQTSSEPFITAEISFFSQFLCSLSKLEFMFTGPQHIIREIIDTLKGDLWSLKIQIGGGLNLGTLPHQPYEKAGVPHPLHSFISDWYYSFIQFK